MEPITTEIVSSGRRSRRLRRGLLCGGQRQEGYSGRAKPTPRRYLPQRRLHSVEGLAPRHRNPPREQSIGRPRHRPWRGRRSISNNCALGRLAFSTSLAKGSRPSPKHRKVQVIHGRGHFEDSQTLRVETSKGQKFVRYEKAIIAVGSKPALPNAFDLGNPASNDIHRSLGDPRYSGKSAGRRRRLYRHGARHGLCGPGQQRRRAGSLAGDSCRRRCRPRPPGDARGAKGV